MTIEPKKLEFLFLSEGVTQLVIATSSLSILVMNDKAPFQARPKIGFSYQVFLWRHVTYRPKRRMLVTKQLIIHVQSIWLTLDSSSSSFSSQLMSKVAELSGLGLQKIASDPSPTPPPRHAYVHVPCQILISV